MSEVHIEKGKNGRMYVLKKGRWRVDQRPVVSALHAGRVYIPIAG